MRQVGHVGALQPPEPDDDPPEELELLGAAHDPPLHTWPDAHAVQLSPSEPHAVTSVPPWHVLVESQHPEQFAARHPPPQLPPATPVVPTHPLGHVVGAPHCPFVLHVTTCMLVEHSVVPGLHAPALVSGIA
jgi:hypothetical protein